MSSACGDFAVRATTKKANTLLETTNTQPIPTADRGEAFKDLTGSMKDPPLYPLPYSSFPHLQRELNLVFSDNSFVPQGSSSR
jgi:hypothetical protein